MNLDDFKPKTSVKMSPEEISKKINVKITLFGLQPEEWSWIMTTLLIIILLAVVSGIVFNLIGGMISPTIPAIANTIMNYVLLSTPFIFYILMKLLRKITKIYGDNTAFLILSQHGIFKILLTSNVRKNSTFSHHPSSNYKRIK